MQTQPKNGDGRHAASIASQLPKGHLYNSRLFERRSINRNNEELMRRRAIEKIEIAVIFMEKNLAQPLRAATLAKLAGLSQPHFYKLFKRAMGRTPIDYFIRLRVNRACELLRETTLLVKKIAPLVGYRDKEYFCRSFKLVCGVTAEEYRKMATKPAKWNHPAPPEACRPEMQPNLTLAQIA